MALQKIEDCWIAVAIVFFTHCANYAYILSESQSVLPEIKAFKSTFLSKVHSTLMKHPPFHCIFESQKIYSAFLLGVKYYTVLEAHVRSWIKAVVRLLNRKLTK